MSKSVDGIVGPGGANHLDLRPNQPEQKPGKPKKSKKPKLPKFKLPKFSPKTLAAALLLLLVVGALWFFVLRSDGELTNEKVIDNVASLVSDLPEGESPTIATIEDVEAIAKQDSFYNGASTGDKVLVYPQSKRAIIYSPSGNKIVKDGKVSVE